jgi:hypothetical protein
VSNTTRKQKGKAATTATFSFLPIKKKGKTESHRKLRKRVSIPVLIKSANMAPMIGTMRKGLTA